MIWDQPFMVKALLAALGVALAAGPLGCFVVWRRMAYFGDATAHAALLGVALGLLFEVPVMLGALFVAASMAVVVSGLAAKGRYAMDTALGVFAHAALAFGMVALSLMPGVRVDLMGYLFGDVLSVTFMDIALIWAGGAGALLVLAFLWRGLLVATASEELAAAEGVNPARDRLILTLLLAVVIAAGMRTVGVLLTTAMLVIPAAAARPFARSPEGMAALAAGIGALSAILGLWFAWESDAPAGPAIVAAAAAVFTATNLGALLRRD